MIKGDFVMKTGVIFGILAASMSVPALAEDVRDHEIAELRSIVDTLRTEVDVLRAHDSDQWLNEARTEHVRGIVQDVLADADTRATLQGDGATSGYKGGFFIKSADGNWDMKINGQIQARFMYNSMPDPTGPDAVDYGFEMRRLKLKFSGTIIDPSWGYKISIINQRNAQGSNNTSGMYVEDAWIKKKFDNGMYARVGQFKAPFLREELVSSSAQLAVERSLINNQWTYGWTQGIELGSKSDRLWWRAMYLDGPNSSNRQSAGVGDAISMVARADYRISGEWSDWKSLSGYGDRSDFYAFVGGAVQWFNMSDKSAAAAAMPPTEYGGMNGTRSYGFTVDGSMGGESWTAYAAFVWSDNEGGSNGNSAWGALVQGGYFIQEDVELFGRWEYSTIGRINSLPLNNKLSVMTLGINYWPVGIKNLKWTTDFGYAFTAIAEGSTAFGSASADYNSSGNGWNADLNDGQWLVRTQLQLLF